MSERKRRVVTKDEKLRLWIRDGLRCVYCQQYVNPLYYQETNMLNKIISHFGWRVEPLEVDHFIPYSKGGVQTDDNMVTSCKTCNRRKSNNDGWEKRNTSILGKILYQVYPMVSSEVKQELRQIKEK